MSRKPTFRCLGCDANVQELGEYAYMVHDHIWEQLNASNPGDMLCVGCVENRLGRQLNIQDFNEWIPINCRYRFTKSKRLQERMGFVDCHDCTFCLKAYPDWFIENKGFTPQEAYPKLFEYPQSKNIFKQQDGPRAIIFAGRPDSNC